MKLLFLDRDGVINIDYGYVHAKENFEFYPEIFAICRAFQNYGFGIVVVTNQSGIARGQYTVDQFLALSDWMIGQFLAEGVNLLAIEYCPHHPDYGDIRACCCRKPLPGMFHTLIQQFTADPKQSVCIGDKSTDMLAAKAAGVRTRCLLTNKLDEDASAATVRFSTHAALHCWQNTHFSL